MSQPLYSNLGFEQPLEISKGSTFPIELRVYSDEENLVPMDLTGYEVKAVLQSIADPLIKHYFDFVNAPGADGVVHGTLPASATAQLTANDRRMSVAAYRWACELKSPTSEILPFCYGPVVVRSNGVDWPEVTAIPGV